MSERERARRAIKEWRYNPVRFVYDNFNVDPDEWQKDALSRLGGDLKPRRRLGMKACTGPGKTTVLSWAGWHRLFCFGTETEHPKGAALSGEGRDNLRDNLWAELSKWQNRSRVLQEAFTWNKEQIFAKDHASDWFLSARSYPKDADSEAIGRSLAGLHSAFPFALLDEIGDMPVEVGQKASQIFTGGTVDGLVAAAGNTTSTTGLLYHIATAGDLWEVITITADPDDPKRTPRVDIDHAREMIRMYGRDNPWVMATILGQFPSQGFNTLLSVDEIEAAMRRSYRPDEIAVAQKRLGIDVARFGDDSTILCPRQGLMVFSSVEMRNARTPEIASRVVLAKTRWGQEREYVDDTGGYGAGVIDSMIQAGYTPCAVNSAGRADDPRYLNKRAEMYFRAAGWVKRGGALPPDRKLVAELTAPTYTFKNGKFQIEPKEQIKKRLGRSPDRADAFVLTFAEPEMPASLTIPGLTPLQEKLLHDYDPFAEQNSSQHQGGDYDPFSGGRL